MMRVFRLDFLPVRGIIFLFLLFTVYITLGRNWLNSKWPIQMDANGYYLYLPAIFVYDDLRYLAFVDNMPVQFDRKYFLYKGSSGGYMTKYSPGMAILELPFFLSAHALARVTGWDTSGYSPPYRLAIAISSLFYSCLGLWIISILLARYYRRFVVNAVILILFLGTNLFFSTVIQAGVTHNYLFMVFAFMLICLDNWRIRQKNTDFALACACVGFSALIRPTEILCGLVPLVYFWNIRKPAISLPWIKANIATLFFGILAFLVFLAPVFLYWKYATGSWIAYTYEQEGFYFDRPSQIWYGLFGFRKGWFSYTPLAALALAGCFWLRKDRNLSIINSSLAIYLPVNLFIVLSWYGWWYGGCFGNRALVPVLAFLAVPLAALLDALFQRKKLFSVAFIAILMLLNVFQTFQYQRQIMHMDSMTWQAYLYIFGKWKLNDAEKQHLETLLDHPDYSQRGKKLDEYFK
jgi:hypothetical protein